MEYPTIFYPTVIFNIPLYNQALINSVTEKYDNFLAIYTASLKTQNGTGFAVYIFDEMFCQQKTPNFCSSITAEILAIESALKWLVNEIMPR